MTAVRSTSWTVHSTALDAKALDQLAAKILAALDRETAQLDTEGEGRDPLNGGRSETTRQAKSHADTFSTFLPEGADHG